MAIKQTQDSKSNANLKELILVQRSFIENLKKKFMPPKEAPQEQTNLDAWFISGSTARMDEFEVYICSENEDV